MKKSLFILFAVSIVLSCSENPEEGTIKDGVTYTTIYGDIAGDSKVCISENTTTHIYSHLWQANDAISVFNGAGVAAAVFTASNGGSKLTDFTGTATIDQDPIYAVYPHDNGNSVTLVDNDPTFTVNYPSSQNYVAGSYDPLSNVYVAVGTQASGDYMLSFNNTTAYLRLSLYGVDSNNNAATVSKIELSTIGGEPIAGSGTVTLSSGNTSVTLAAVSENSGTYSTVTLNCTGGVTIGTTASNPTDFYFSVPAVDYGAAFQGYQIKIYSGSGATQTYQWRNVSRILSANVVRRMAALEYNPQTSGSTSLLETGPNFNLLIKSLASGTTFTDAGTACSDITRITFVSNKNMTNIPASGAIEGIDYAVVSLAESDYPAIATFKDGVITIQTAAESFTANASSNSMLRDFPNLQAFEGLNTINTSNVTTFAHMFRRNSIIREVDISSWDTSAGKSATYMFAGNNGLETLTLGPNCTFYDCNNFSYMFSVASSLESIDLSCINSEGRSTYARNLSYMFNNCTALRSVSFKTNPVGATSNYAIRYVTDMSYMFNGCSSLEQLDLSGIVKASYSNASDNTSFMFKGCSSLTSLILHYQNGSKISTFESMFEKCSSLTSISVYGSSSSGSRVVNTGGAKTTKSMFRGCISLSDLSCFKFNMANDTNMAYMFDSTAVTSLDLSTWDTSKVVDMRGMFSFCGALTSLNLSNWNTSKVKNMNEMFRGCSALTGTLDLSHFSTASLTTLAGCFRAMSSISALNLTGWDFTSLTGGSKLEFAFYSLPSLHELYLGDKAYLSGGASPSSFFASSGQGFSYRTGSINGLYIYCSQAVADWLAKTTLRWIHSGYNGNTPITVDFYDWTNNTTPLTVTWSAN